MERGQVLVIAVVVAALALFGLRFFSGSSDVELAALGRNERLGSDGLPLEGGSGRPGDPGRSRLGNFGSGADRARSGGGAGGAADHYGSGSGRSGSSVILGGLGTSGSTRDGGGTGGSSGSGGSGGTAASSGTIGPKTERRGDLVESLGSRPPTQNDLAAPPPPDEGEDVALKINSTQDIADQNGRTQGDIKEADSGDEGVKVDENTRVEFPNAGNASKEGSISFTLKPDWAGSDATDNAIVQIRQEHEWNNRLEIVKNGEFMRFILTDNTGKETDISYRIPDWQPGEERQVEFSWGDGRTEALVNNQVVGRNEYPGELQFAPGTPMIFGGDYASSNYQGAKATIGNFTLAKSPFFTK